MLTLSSQVGSSLPGHGSDCYPVVFTPLDESIAYDRLDAYLEQQSDRQSFAEASGVDDEWIDELVDAGFDAETLPAMQLVPIAFVAWASDSVTDEESQAVVWSILESRLFEHPEAASRVQSWLDERPAQELWDLWLAYTQCQLDAMPSVVRQIVGSELLEQATAIALASGGFMGFGKVCVEEQKVLDAIGEVYHL